MIGLGLSAACGLRVFVPLLVLSIAAKSGAVHMAPSMSWVGSTEALVAFAVATVVEIAAYKIPWLDHALDTVASPAAIIAGAIVSASQIGAIDGVSPLLQWSSAIIAGGAAAGLVQTGTVSTRAASTVTTAGLMNPIISACQSVLAIIMSVLAVVMPALAAGAAILMIALVVCGIALWRSRSKRRAFAAATTRSRPRTASENLPRLAA